MSHIGTYSFSEVSLSITHPNFGTMRLTGQGTGEISLTNDNDRATTAIGADGGVVVNKIRDRRATLTVTVLQTSTLHNEFGKFFNYLETAPTSQWAAASAVIKSLNTRETTTLTGVVPQKQADKPYGQQAGNNTWTFIVADAQNNYNV